MADSVANSSLGRILGAGAVTVLLSIGGSVAAVSYSRGETSKQVEVNTEELQHRRGIIYELIPKLDVRTENMEKDIGEIKNQLKELRNKLP